MLMKAKDPQPGAIWSIVPPLSATTIASLLVLADTASILASGYLAYDSLIVYSSAQNLYLAATVFVWITSLSLMNFGGLYRYDAATHPTRHLHGIIIAIATAFLFMLAAAFTLKMSETLSRLWLVSFAGASGASAAVLRLGLSVLLRRLLEVRGARRSLAIVGTGEQSRKLVEILGSSRDRPFRVFGTFDDASEGSDNPSGAPSNAGSIDRLFEQARLGLIDDIVVALPWSQDERIMTTIGRLRELPVNVYLASDMVGFRTEFRPPASHYEHLPIHEVVSKPMSGWDSVIKLVEDYALASVILMLISPLLAAIAIAIKLDSRGPVIFRQQRVGFNNEVFSVFKFRSMYHGEHAQKTVQATRGDPRVTRVGRYLRRWSLDELPQIFNVLNGTMSLVGPRPHALDHNEEFAQRAQGYFARHRVKPGITGLAQVRGFRGETDTPEKLHGRVRNDIYYAENWSLSLDLRILLQTAAVCILGRNAY